MFLLANPAWFDQALPMSSSTIRYGALGVEGGASGDRTDGGTYSFARLLRSGLPFLKYAFSYKGAHPENPEKSMDIIRRVDETNL